jgi:UDP-N-acetylglucosamine--N-acetylmuramyl-(pentapeptide) pyrophosphoryl-undecaprenol N-acetylglucosamine transferase
MNGPTGKPGRRCIALSAGGTGGHLFPAQALGEELVRRGHEIHLLTDERVREYGRDFPAAGIHQIPSASLSFSSPWLMPGRALRLARGFAKARGLLKRMAPAAVAGFGGYPSFPPLLAAARLGIPSLIHEQNAVMGRANRFLSRFATRIASSFPDLHGLPAPAEGKVVLTGNPVRKIVLDRRGAPYRAAGAGEAFRLLVFGGSQGARFFSDFFPEVVRAIPDDVRASLYLTQQCRHEDLERVRAAYSGLGVAHDLQVFFADMPDRIANSHLVVCRAGASTVAELGVIGRPAVLVPLPHAIDNDQLRNAESFARAGAGWVREQTDLKSTEFAAFLAELRYQDARLQAAAAAALAHGRPDAAQRLADLVETLAVSGATPVR